MRTKVLLVWAVLFAILIAVLIGMVIARAGDKETLQAQLSALIQEERACLAEQAMYQIKFRENQDRLPEIQKSKAMLQEQLKALDEKEKAAKVPDKAIKPVEKK